MFTLVKVLDWFICIESQLLIMIDSTLCCLIKFYVIKLHKKEINFTNNKSRCECLDKSFSKDCHKGSWQCFISQCIHWFCCWVSLIKSHYVLRRYSLHVRFLEQNPLKADNKSIASLHFSTGRKLRTSECAYWKNYVIQPGIHPQAGGTWVPTNGTPGDRPDPGC